MMLDHVLYLYSERGRIADRMDFMRSVVFFRILFE